MSARQVVRAATRGSALARWQTAHVAALIEAATPGDVEVELVVVSTEGDRRQDVPLDRIGGRGVFVKEVQAAVLDGRADIAVHSAKDLPAARELLPETLVLGCIPPREDPRDALVGSALSDLPAGALVATGSVRRRAQLASVRPDLTFADLRGNIDTRLERAEHYDAIVVAAAALKRLDRGDRVAELLDPRVMLPQVGQGALAVECREDDERTRSLLAEVDDHATRRAVEAERSFLAALGGGCDLSVGAHATTGTDGADIELTGMVASRDGHVLVRATRTGADTGALGRDVASFLLDGCGGAGLLGD